jgi:septal ring factor EnvC (AmiA/AmiB activator)
MEIHIHVHHHQHGDEKLFTEIKSINSKIETIMATIEQFESALSRIDAATTKTAQELQALKDQIAGAGLPAELESEVLAKLEAAATKLEGIGGNVENPVPDETTDPNA